MAIGGAVSQSAVDVWDELWATSKGRAVGSNRTRQWWGSCRNYARGARRVLDLGCGVGRHALLLAEHGFDVEAIDGSPAGFAVVRETAAARGLP